MQEAFSEFLSRDAGPLAQFIKYAIAGGLATLAHVFLFFAFGRFIWPCLAKEDPFLRFFGKLRLFTVSDDYLRRAELYRARNAAFSNFTAFFFANIFCYLLNRMFVFTPGRYSVVIEFVLFIIVSAVCCLIGTCFQSFLINKAKVQTTIAFCVNIFVSLAINFVLRKLFVFNG